MSYRVFARKYRPQQFSEVVGQEPIVRTLQNAITTGKLAQAYLFVGPRGVGKTSTARIFAKALNCHEGPTIHPCGVCAACLEIAEGRNLDVLEIDGASNNSVENVRTLRENAAFAPVRGPYKIYLIDEVHMLTTAAFNALLKTLEEPPPHVKFLFATTESQKLPATITSRCQRFDLRRLSEKAIADHLLTIAKKETITLSPEAAQIVAHGADGALRDAESMLDQMVAFCGETITAEDVQHVFGFTSHDIIEQLGKALLKNDVRTALTLVAEQEEAGKDLARLLSGLISFFRDLLVAAVQPMANAVALAANPQEVSSEKLLLLLEELEKTEEQLRWASNKKLKLEIGIIRAAHLLEEVSLTEVVEALAALREGAPLLQSGKKQATSSGEMEKSHRAENDKRAAEKTDSISQSVSSAASEEISVKPAVELEKASSPVAEQIQVGAKKEPLESSQDSTMDPWPSVAQALTAESPLKFGWIAFGKFQEQREHTFHVEFPPSCEMHTETLFWSQAKKKIQEALSKNLGKKVELVCSFTGAELPEEPFTEISVREEVIMESPKKGIPQLAKQKKETSPETAPTLTAEELEEFKNDPLIRKALEIFQGELV